MNKPKKLIEVAMPIKEISAESVRDKSIRHGHISTLHLWWARRPLPVCRAVVFASLVPDPLDPNCPPAFKKATELLLGKKSDLGDAYRPYKDIPHTAAIDPMEDNLRNRMMMFIGKFSDKYIENEKNGKKTPAKYRLANASLIKWDNKNNEKILTKARKLIFVSHNARNGASVDALLQEYDRLAKAIKTAERKLYQHRDRHLHTKEVAVLEQAKEEAIHAFLARMPKVFDPFAGGGAIPLEAARLGCNSYGNDINPVAHIIQRGSCEFPQKFGKPIRYSVDEFVRMYGEKELEKQRSENRVMGDQVDISNRLAHDVEYYAHQMLRGAEQKIGHLYPSDLEGEKPIAYYWARVGTCANPSCGVEVPLLKQFYLSRKKGKNIYLNPIIQGKEINFEILGGKNNLEGWVTRSGLTCPCCHNVTEIAVIKKQSKIRNGKLKQRLIAVIDDDNGKKYRLPKTEEIELALNLEGLLKDELLPHEKMLSISDLVSGRGWGIDKWKDLFTDRQLLAMQTFVEELQDIKESFGSELSDYQKAVVTYLGILVDRIAPKQVSFAFWDVSRETISNLFGRQAIPMIFDFVESVPFCSSSGSVINQIDWILRYINSEISLIPSNVYNASSGEKNQFNENELDVVITDPPYYDAIAYADLSDFFYVWLKRTVFDLFPMNFATPQTPKDEECTALRHHHKNSESEAFTHFEQKLLHIFDAIEYQTKDLVSIMFAHQSTKAWTTLCNSILGAQMNIMSSWSMDTELQNRTLALVGDTLSTSVTVACKPALKSGIGDYKEVSQEILHVIKAEVQQLYGLGFRGADLLTACFGKAVSVFGQYKSVEKANGDPVTVAELLEMAREAAFNAIVSDIDTDDLTRFYIGWLNLFGFSEAVHDDVRRISQIGLSVDIDKIYDQQILIHKDDKGQLGDMKTRIGEDSRLGLRSVRNHDIDISHRMMYLYDPANASRTDLLDYIAEKAPHASQPVWRVLNSLAELLPDSKNMKDRKLATGLLSNQENLLREAKNRKEITGEQSTIEFE